MEAMHRLLIGSLVLVAGCGFGGGSGGGTVPGITGGKQLSIVSGNNQSGSIGSALPNPFVVAVKDGSGAPVAGINIIFTISAGNGSLSASSAMTDAQGKASTTLTLGTTVGANRVLASATGVQNSPVTFGATGTSSGVPTIVISSGNNQTGQIGANLPNAFVVTLLGANGSPVSSGTVTFAVTAGGGMLSAMTGSPNAQGQCSTILTLGPQAGSNTVTASASGFSGSPCTFTATGVAMATLTFVADVQPILQANCVSCHSPGQMTATSPLVTYADVRNGTTRFGYSPSAYVTPGQPAQSLIVQKTTGNGTMISHLTPQQAQTISTWVLQGAVYSSSPPSRIDIASGNNGQGMVGTALPPLVVVVKDTNGNGAPGVAVTFAIASGGGSLSATAVTTDGQGRAQTILTLGTTAGPRTVTASAPGLTNSPLTFTETGLAGAPGTIAIVSGNNQTAPAGTPLQNPLVVVVKDASGNSVAGATVTFAATSGGGTPTPATATTDAQGLASSSLRVGTTAGPNAATATVGNLTPVTFAATGIPGAAAALAIVSGNNQTGAAGAPLPTALGVRVVDLYANAVANVTVNFTVTAGGGTLNPAASTSNALGLASTILTLGAAGTNTVQASATGVTAVTFTETATSNAATMTIASGDAQSGVGGTALAPLVVLIRDNAGAPVVGQVVTFAAASGGGSLSAMTVATNTQGQASTVLTLGIAPGTNTVTASAVGVNGSPLTFNETGTAGSAASIALVSGDNQTAVVGTPLSPFVVVVKDANGYAVSGFSVSFTITAGNGQLSAASATTNAQGQASTVLTLGTTAGSNTVNANGTGLSGSPVTFRGTGTAGAASQLVKVSGDAQTAPARMALPNPLVVAVRDTNGNPVSGFSVTFAILTGGGTLSAGTVSTDGQGQASSRLTLGPSAGSNTVNVTGTGLTAVVFTETATQAASLTFNADVKPILDAKCIRCHAPLGIRADAPLTTYAQVRFGTTVLANVPPSYVVPMNPAQSLIVAKTQMGGTMFLTGGLTAAEAQTFFDWVNQGALESSTGTATQIMLASGNNQTGPAGSMLPNPLVVTVLDASNLPVSGVTVTFAATAGGGSVNPPSAVTNSSGQAQTVLTLGTAPATNNVTASANGAGGTPLTGSPILFTETGSTSTYSGAPLAGSTNPLDVAALTVLQAQNIEPTPLTDDGAFLRRVTAAVAGRIPTQAELDAFLSDTSATKRQAKIDALLASTDYAQHWQADNWGPWLQTGSTVTDNNTTPPTNYPFDDAMRTNLMNDVSVVDIAKKLAQGQGNEGQAFFKAHAVTYRVDQVMLTFTGITSKCARCHDHMHTTPQDDPRWVQDDNYSLYAFDAESLDDATEILKNGNIKTDATGAPIIMQPNFVVDGYATAPAPGTLPKLFDTPGGPVTPVGPRRAAFANLLTSSNAFFRGTAHRVWSEIAAPLMNPNEILYNTLSGVKQKPVLDALAKALKDQNGSLKGFLRICLNSKLWQLSSAGGTTANDAYLARFKVRRMNSETIEQGIAVFAGLAYNSDPNWQQAFGYPMNRATITERTNVINLGQPALLMNSTAPGQLSPDYGGASMLTTTLAQAVDAGTMTKAAAVTRLFQNALSRSPTAAELSTIMALPASTTTRELLDDVAIGIAASSEFVSQR